MHSWQMLWKKVLHNRGVSSRSFFSHIAFAKLFVVSVLWFVLFSNFHKLPAFERSSFFICNSILFHSFPFISLCWSFCMSNYLICCFFMHNLFRFWRFEILWRSLLLHNFWFSPTILFVRHLPFCLLIVFHSYLTWLKRMLKTF